MRPHSNRRRVGRTRSPQGVRRSIALMLFALCSALLLDGSTALAGTSTIASSTARAAATSATNGAVGDLWYDLEDVPSAETIRAVAARYDVVVLNAWATEARALLKSLNPDIKVLVYKDLSSTRSYAVTSGRDQHPLPTGVGYVEADPTWFAVDTAGNRIEWRPYPKHWQMKVWNPDYQAAWLRNVTSEVEAVGWDGVFADNGLSSLSPYSNAVLQGTSSRAESDALIRRGVDELVNKAGGALRASGKLMVTNVPDGRLDLDRWFALAGIGGAMDENFAHWGTDPDVGYVTDWGPSGWIGQTEELHAPLTLLVTRSAAGDSTALRYGYGSALVRSVGQVVWTGETDGSYRSPELFSWQTVNIGAPLQPGAKRPSGVWVREFQSGLVLVNPGTTSASADITSGWCDLEGRSAGTRVSVPPHDANLLVRC